MYLILSVSLSRYRHRLKQTILQAAGTPNAIINCLKENKDDADFDPNCKRLVVKRIVQQMKDYRYFSSLLSMNEFNWNFLQIEPSANEILSSRPAQVLLLVYGARISRLQPHRRTRLLRREGHCVSQGLLRTGEASHKEVSM